MNSGFHLSPRERISKEALGRSRSWGRRHLSLLSFIHTSISLDFFFLLVQSSQHKQVNVSNYLHPLRYTEIIMLLKV